MPLHPPARALLQQTEEAGLPHLNELDPTGARAQAASRCATPRRPSIPRATFLSNRAATGSARSPRRMLSR